MIKSFTTKILTLYKKTLLKKKGGAVQSSGSLICKKKQSQLKVLYRRLLMMHLFPNYKAWIFIKYYRLFRSIKRRVPAKTSQSMFFKFELSTRWLLRQPYLVKRNPQLRMVDIRRYKAYQRLFAYGYLVAGARSFFMQRDINQGKYSNRLLFIKYNHIVNDISKFKTWNLKGFCMRPIYMKRLMGLYFGESYRDSHKNIGKVSQIKSNKIRFFFHLFQYSLLSVVYQAFRLIGVVRLLHYIKSGYLYKNGVSIKTPFLQCYPGDVIQLNLFSLFIEPWGMDKSKTVLKYDDYLKLKKKTSWYIIRAAHMTLILSYFRNFLVKRPFRKKRYSKIVYNDFFSIKRLELRKFMDILMEFPFQLYSTYKGSNLETPRPAGFARNRLASTMQPILSNELVNLIVFLMKYHKSALAGVDSLSLAIHSYNSLKAYMFRSFWVSLTAEPGEEHKGYTLIESKADNLLRTGLAKMSRTDKVIAKVTVANPRKVRRKRKGLSKKRPRNIRSLKFFRARVLRKWRDYLSRTGPYIPQQPTTALPLAIWTTYTLYRFFNLRRWFTHSNIMKITKFSLAGTSAATCERILRQNWTDKLVNARLQQETENKKSSAALDTKQLQKSLSPVESVKPLQSSQLYKVIRQKVATITTDQSVAKSQKSWWRWHHNLTKESLLVDEDMAALSLVSRHIHIKGRRSFLNKDGIRFLISFVS